MIAVNYTFKMNFNAKTLNEKIENGIANAIDILAPKLINYAKDNHRYENRTGNLSESIDINKLRNGLELYASATYGKFIHNGFKSWYPDPWLEDTIKKNEKLIIDTFNNEINKSLNK